MFRRLWSATLRLNLLEYQNLAPRPYFTDGEFCAIMIWILSLAIKESGREEE